MFRRTAVPIGNFVLLIWMVSVAVFLLLEMIPGDPVDSLVPPGASDEMRELARTTYGLDEPLVERYLSWIGAVLQGDFGRSFTTQTDVLSSIAERAPVSLELAILSMIVALAVSIPVGVWSAYRPGGRLDRIATALTSATLAVPSFVLGILLVFVFGVQLGVLPTLGWVPFSEDPVEHLLHIALPVLTLAAGECVLFTRLLKGDMMATLQQDHVLSARARGLPTSRILVRHALRQSSFSLVTVSGVVIGRLIGGTVIVELIFSLPGMGSLVVNSILSRDFIVVQAVVLLSALLYLTINTVVDLAYPLLDPRLRKVRAS
ncbi:ABC transporter permease [Rhodococcus coprophilus]|uniref:Peptide ABC transporter permease n=1 Tax=Rhodococcus coprophilus TaxID=38310 RepID=A0A2X4U994_9NOCA|nr:ABC transporter permease [Rhodococcus coprophilus]MBM7461370.1 peptide/nickel transport system permease protein [Rhodococcus coprophilus]SQI29320.1 peptide ABC transporter permease [Rhodococcus coprophilus]